MLITCPECSARFVVKSELIGAKGRRVKCAKCKKDWFQKPDKDAIKKVEEIKLEEEPSVPDPMQHGSNVPALQKGEAPLSLKIAFACTVVIFLFVTTIVSANSILPNLSSYYGLFGIYDSSEIAIYDAAVEQIESGKYSDLLVSGKIVNESKEEKHLPDLRLIIYDDNDAMLKEITLDSEGIPIAPGEAVDFQNRIPRIPKMSATVVMDLGNSLDLASR